MRRSYSRHIFTCVCVFLRKEHSNPFHPFISDTYITNRLIITLYGHFVRAIVGGRVSDNAAQMIGTV